MVKEIVEVPEEKIVPEEVPEEEIPEAKPIEKMTIEELMAEITRITALIAKLKQQLAELLASQIPDICLSITFERNLKRGMSGSDVKCLQALLNSNVETKLAESGPGSPGNETDYFGLLTKSAVIKFQEKYKDEILTPLGLEEGTGIVGERTRAKLNTLLGH